MIELLLAITVLGILSMVAQRAWRSEHLMASRQLGASCLIEAHRRLESLNARLGRYPERGSGLSMLGYGHEQAPCGDGNVYRLSLQMAAAPERYTLIALAQGRQARDGDLLLEVEPGHPDPDQRLVKRHRAVDGSVLPGWGFRPGL